MLKKGRGERAYDKVHSAKMDGAAALSKSQKKLSCDNFHRNLVRGMAVMRLNVSWEQLSLMVLESLSNVSWEN